MKNKLSSILNRKKSKGFTLVELLIVIAIIAILVLLVIVALDPLERIRDAQDRNAQNSVRQAATAIAACITKELGDGVAAGTVFSATEANSPCGSAANLATNSYISNANSLSAITTWQFNGSADACVIADNPNGHANVAWAFSTGTITDPDNSVDGTCP